MKRNQKGFSHIEIIIVLAVIGLLVGIGWFVWQKNKFQNRETINRSSEAQQSVKVQQNNTQEVKQSVPYSFTELGITMDILDGWEVETNHIKEDGFNYYIWYVVNKSADSKISLSSSGFRGGFGGCEGKGSLVQSKVHEVAATQNANLLFMSWSYTNGTDLSNQINIVRADEKVLSNVNDAEIPAIENKDIKAGEYFLCLGSPLPGFSLSLNNNPSPGSSRNDSIRVLSSAHTETKWAPLPDDLKSYSDIKTMLTSIK